MSAKCRRTELFLDASETTTPNVIYYGVFGGFLSKPARDYTILLLVEGFFLGSMRV